MSCTSSHVPHTSSHATRCGLVSHMQGPSAIAMAVVVNEEMLEAQGARIDSWLGREHF